MIWKCSLWWEQRNRVKLYAKCNTTSIEVTHSIQSSKMSMVHLVLFWLLIFAGAANAIGVPVAQEIPFMTSMRGVTIASAHAIGASINITGKWNDVCEIPANTSAIVVISSCCDGSIMLLDSKSTIRHDQGRDHSLIVPPAKSQRYVKIRGTSACLAFALCNTGITINPLPKDTTVLAVMQFTFLRISWQPSILDQIGASHYEVAISRNEVDVIGGCTVGRHVHKQKTRRYVCQSGDNSGFPIEAASNESTWVCRTMCLRGSTTKCFSTIDLANIVKSDFGPYYVNVFVVFSGIRMAYNATEFCYSAKNNQKDCLIAKKQQDLANTLQRLGPVPPANSHKRAYALQKRYDDLSLSMALQTPFGTEYSATYSLNVSRAPREALVRAAIFIYSCTDQRATLSLFQNATRFGRVTVSKDAAKFATLRHAFNRSGPQQVLIKYAVSRLDVAEQPRLSVTTLFYTSRTRELLPPLSSRTALSLVTVKSNENRCLLQVSFALSCTNRSEVCRVRNRKNILYRMQQTSRPRMAKSCSTISGVSGKPLDKESMKSLEVSRLVGNEQSKQESRFWTYRGKLNVTSTGKPNQRYFLQLFWHEETSDAYIPFSEMEFRIGQNCSVLSRQQTKT